MKTNEYSTGPRRAASAPPDSLSSANVQTRPASAAPTLRKRATLRRGMITFGMMSLTTVFSLNAQMVTQTFTLHSGWNIVFLEVSPSNPAPTAVFASLPLASVWTRVEPVSTAQFIQDPDEASFNETDWLRWVPGEPDFVSTLRAVLGRRAYLLKLANGPVSWQATGKIAVRSFRWTPDSYNLRSFPIDPASPPTFRQFFQSSAAHYDSAQDRLEKIYRLGTDGKWVLAGSNDLMSAGEAYWVYCQGESTFTGPLELDIDTGETIDFGQELDRATLQFANLTDVVRTVRVRQLGPVIPGLLAYQRFNVTNAFEWADLPDPFTFDVVQGSPKRVQLAVRRSRMPSTDYDTVLEITDGQGTRYRVPVTAGKIAGSMPYAGLWAGNVTINAVSQPHFGTLLTNLYVLVDGQAKPLDAPGVIASTNESGLITAKTAAGPVPVYNKVERLVDVQTPTPTKSEFTMRLLIHVDASGRSRLLKEVVQMWRDGTYTNDARGNQVVDKPGAYVLLTRDDLLSRFKGATMREGVPVGQRLSAIGFDFDGHGTNHMALSGTFAPGNSMTGTIQVDSDYPLNPFRHKYHPDHDNLDKSFDPITDPSKKEAYAVTRQLQFEFATNTKGTASTPDPGYSVMEGAYRETLTGLHRQPILVQGNFRLSRASFIADLNPSPTP